MPQDRWDQAKKLTLAQVLTKNLQAKTWADCYEAALGSRALEDKNATGRALVPQLLDATETKLTGTYRLIIWERISRGEMLFDGQGLQIEDDLFQVAGRANWILRNLFAKNFGHLKPDSTETDRKQLHARWVEFLDGGEPAEWTSPYPTPHKGLSELHSLNALEALIVSLQSSPEKDAMIRTCLRNVYGLSDMPSDPRAQARMCDPNRWIHNYLDKITSDRQSEDHRIHDPKWWAQWWKENADALVWDEAEARFFLPGS